MQKSTNRQPNKINQAKTTNQPNKHKFYGTQQTDLTPQKGGKKEASSYSGMFDVYYSKYKIH